MRDTERTRHLCRMQEEARRRVSAQHIETVSNTRALSEAQQRAIGIDILIMADHCWNGLSTYREQRERCKRYTYGDQWGDTIEVDGETITEGEYIRRQGSVPLKNNLIRRLVRNVLGVYASQAKEPTCTARDREEQSLGETMSIVLQCNMQLNRANELYARTMEEFLIGGLAVHRKSYGWRNNKLDCWTDIVPTTHFFVDGGMRDFRGSDVGLIGELHDISFDQLCGTFAKSREDFTRLSKIYAEAREMRYLSQWQEQFGTRRITNLSFYSSGDSSLCRVIEVWRRERKARYRCHDYLTGEIFKIEENDFVRLVEDENAKRIEMGISSSMSKEDIPLIHAEWFIDNYWQYYFLSPLGDILAQGETPYAHGEHPYVFKAYPFIDGEVHSFVSDVIDQQRYVNRLVTAQDWVMRASAKGVLLFPEDALPDDMTREEIGDAWSRYNSVLFINTKNGTPMPQQVNAATPTSAISELLGMQLKFFEDISGVNGALQGKPGFSGMAASLYAQQTQNATTSLLDILNSFSSFITDGAMKDVKNIQQFYTTRRVIAIAGRNSEHTIYDPEEIRDVEFDLSIVESTNTPVFRAMANDMLLKIWESGQISVEQLLEVGDFPFADKLLQNIKTKQEKMSQAAAQGGQIEAAPTMNEVQQQTGGTGANMQ